MALLAATGSCASTALACKGAQALLDNGLDQEGSWNFPRGNPPFVEIGDGAAKLHPLPDTQLPAFYAPRRFDDADICVDVVFPPASEVQAPVGAGLAFWGVNNQTYYSFTASTNGVGRVAQWRAGKPPRQVFQQPAASIITLPGATNSLRIVVKGHWGTAYINDKAFITVPGPGGNGGYIAGLVAESAQPLVTTWTFQHLKVTNSR